MTPDHAIVVSNVTKHFRIHRYQGTTLKEMVVKNLFAPREIVEFFAVDDVSFSLQRGHSLAIVGGNGSGKSTLLKMIAGISTPTSGTIQVNGKVVALLELGAAFQPEFTGMENIFLQCSVLGLTRGQILARLDSIIEFSELERFIHTPVKRYSSGMFMRLAFAIAFHVDADIIVLDEVLAVGDQAFQAKCKQRLRAVRGEGKTILFVSHIPEQIAAIADDILWLDKGRELAYGTAVDILPRFFGAMQEKQDYESRSVHIDDRAQAALPSARFPAEKAFLRRVAFRSASGAECQAFDVNDPIHLLMTIELTEPLDQLEVLVAFGTLDSVRAAWFESDHLFGPLAVGTYEVEAVITDHFLRPALYLASFKLGDPDDEKRTYDMHLRLHAISIHQEGVKVSLERYERKLLPWGEWQDYSPEQARPV